MGAGSDADAATTMVYSNGASIFQNFYHLGNRRALLADGVCRYRSGYCLVVDDRVEGNGGLASLAVADDGVRLPRPMGIMESIALSPVAMGSRTVGGQ